MSEYEAKAGSPPCLIVAHSDMAYEAAIARGFRRLGWDVYLARSGPEARRLVRMLEADVVILEAELPDESGWLTCDKLTREPLLIKVILVGDDLSPRRHDLAAFVGASALVGYRDGLAPLVEELCAPAMPAAS
jgi:CheY-like chemotaxis protein